MCPPSSVDGRVPPAHSKELRSEGLVMAAKAYSKELWVGLVNCTVLGMAVGVAVALVVSILVLSVSPIL